MRKPTRGRKMSGSTGAPSSARLSSAKRVSSSSIHEDEPLGQEVRSTSFHGPSARVSFAKEHMSARSSRGHHTESLSSQEDGSGRHRSDTGDTVYSVNQRNISFVREASNSLGGSISRSRVASSSHGEQADFSAVYLPPLSYNLLQEFAVLDEMRVQRIKMENRRRREIEERALVACGSPLSPSSPQEPSSDGSSPQAAGSGTRGDSSFVVETTKLSKPSSKDPTSTNARMPAVMHSPAEEPARRRSGSVVGQDLTAKI